MRYRLLLFDLFRTVATLAPDAPTGQVHEPGWRAAMQVLHPLFARLLPELSFEQFLDALVGASDEIASGRAPEQYEVPIALRYGRALGRIGVVAPRSESLAEQLSLAQLAAQVAGSEVCPQSRELLRELKTSYTLGLVSNFDHGPTVPELLARQGLGDTFDSVVVSIDFGRRKPHPAIFREALARLSAPAEAALFIGDSPGDDVAGASAAGLDTAWLNAANTPYPAALPQPTYVLRELGDLRRILVGAG